MKITDKIVKQISNLSMLDTGNIETEQIISELNLLLEYMKKLDELNTDEVKSLSHIFSVTNVLRSDELTPSFDRARLLANAPEHNNTVIVVPKTVE